MKKSLFILSLLCVSILLPSFAPQEKSNLTIVVSGLRSSDGAVLLSLYNRADGFPRNPHAAIRKEKLPIVNGTATVSFKGLPYGSYAAALLHDENNNLDMDFNSLGMPREGYGFSNDAKARFGPPKFDKAAFKINAPNAKIVINTKYLLN